LCRAAAIRQHVRMHTTLGQDVAGIAAGLDHRAIHVWLLDYQRSQRRQPLCALLAIYLGISADEVALNEGEHGRPELALPWHGNLQFNWSHSGNKAIIAVARNVVPGIDIERLRPRPKVMQLAERFFHPAEVAALEALEENQREEAFLRLWTGKEAVLKALGRGLAFGLDRLQVSANSGAMALHWLDGEDAASWQLDPLDVGADYGACLAWRGPRLAIECRTLADSG
jgi:4'-phosphopantetheinyl transferase